MIPVVSAGVRSTNNLSNDTAAGVFVPASAFVIATINGRNDNGSAPAVPPISDTASLSWATQFNNAITTTNRIATWIGTAGGSDSTVTVSWNWGSATSRAAWQVSVFTGQNAANPVVSGTSQTRGTTSSSAASAGNVPAPASANNVQWWVVGHTTNSVTPEAGWVESVDTGITASSVAVWSGYTTGADGDTTPTATLAASGGWRSAYFEINAQVASGVVGDSTALRNTRRRRR